MGDFADCRRVVDEILRQYGQIDYLVNNAGAGHARTTVNLSGQFFMSQAVLGHFIERKFGRIVMVSSDVGQSGRFGQAKTLALETVAKGITVNCVVLGAMHALGTPDDVAEAVRYLVSDQAHYLTGALLPVAGGLLMM